MDKNSSNPFPGVPIIGGPPSPAAQRLIQEAQQKALMRAAGIAAMRNEFAAAALTALIIADDRPDGDVRPNDPEGTEIRDRAFAWGTAMAEEATRLLEADLEAAQK